MRVPSSLVFGFTPDKRKKLDSFHGGYKGVKNVAIWGRDAHRGVESNREAAQRQLDDRNWGSQTSGTPWEACHSQPTDISTCYLVLKLIHWTWCFCLSVGHERESPACLNPCGSVWACELQYREVQWAASLNICTSGAQSCLF